MKKNQLFSFVFIIAFIFQGCSDITIELNHVPKNTPNEPIFITGNFNFWDPADDNYIMQLKPDSSGYFIKIPQGFGRLEYKFTRGSWKSVEGDKCGFETQNRIRPFLSDKNILLDSVGSWKDLNPVDCEYVTLIIDELPENTPKQDIISLAGDFNRWGNTDSTIKFETDENGRKTLRFIKPLGAEKIQFKITRGNLASAECDEFGNEIAPRVLNFNLNDSLHISIDNWLDIAKTSKRNLTVIINKYPPTSDPLYLTSNLNNWYPKDVNFKFNKLSNGKQFLVLPNHPQSFEYKITRGAWENEEVDLFGNLIPNKYYSSKKDIDTLNIDVLGWKDQKEFKPGNFTFMVRVPDNTNGDTVYLATDYNDWDEKDNDFKLEKVTEKLYFFTAPKSRNPFYFKFTRGSWAKVEVNKMGKEIENREYIYNGSDTVKLTIENWKDRVLKENPLLTLVIDEFPANTPKKDKLFLASDFSGMWWSPNDDDFVFTQGNDKKYYLTFKKREEDFEFKITRGSWENVETNLRGDDIENRFLEIGIEDTVTIQIKGWKDLTN